MELWRRGYNSLTIQLERTIDSKKRERYRELEEATDRQKYLEIAGDSYRQLGIVKDSQRQLEIVRDSQKQLEIARNSWRQLEQLEITRDRYRQLEIVQRETREKLKRYGALENELSQSIIVQRQLEIARGRWSTLQFLSAQIFYLMILV